MGLKNIRLGSKTETEGKMLHGSIYRKYLEQANLWSQKVEWRSPGLSGDSGKDRGGECSARDGEKVLGIQHGDGYTTLGVCFTPLNFTLTSGERDKYWVYFTTGKKQNFKNPQVAGTDSQRCRLLARQVQTKVCKFAFLTIAQVTLPCWSEDPVVRGKHLSAVS